MDFIILAGGTGTRLGRLTAVVNKHLLPVLGEPAIIHSVRTAVTLGADSIIIVTTPEDVSAFAKLYAIGGEPFSKLHSLAFVAQPKPGGIAEAISLTRPFCRNSICILLGDNIFGDPEGLADDIPKFTSGAQVWLKPVDSPESYGIAESDGNGKVLSVEEKPRRPKTNLAVVGIYLFDTSVWERIDSLSVSARGELEVADLLNSYASDDKLYGCELHGFWVDIGESIQQYEKVATWHGF